MPGDEYSSATGGSLKLKGVNPSSKVSKSHKKKKKPNPAKQDLSSKAEKATEGAEETVGEAVEEHEVADGSSLTRTKSEKEVEEDLEAEIAARNGGKTEAELRHEEHRRRRVSAFPDS